MTSSLLSPKYQIVIPKVIRQTLNLKPGQKLNVTRNGDHIELHPILTPQQLVGFLADCRQIEFKREADRKLP